jgi:hypothetical protein
MRRVGARSILLAGWLPFLLYAYPGYMDTAAVDSLIDSRYGQIGDWHSPIMTWVWEVVGIVISGPAGMLLLQSGLFLFGAHALLARVMSPRAAALAAAGLLLFPPVMANMGVIWPDSQLIGFLTAGAACITSDRRALRFVGLGLCLIGGGMVDGGSLAVLPIVVLGFCWRDGMRGWRRFAIAAACWLAIAIAMAGLDVWFVDHPTRRNEVELAMYDIVGVLDRADPIDPAEVRAALAGVPLAGDDVQHRAHVVSGDSLLFSWGPDRVFEWPDPPGDAAIDAIVGARTRLAWAEPGAYLAHRGHHLLRLLALERRGPWVPVYASFMENREHRIPTAHMAHRSRVQYVMVGWVRVPARTLPFLFFPYVYFTLALVVLPLAAVRRQHDVVMLVASALAFVLALGVVTWDVQPHYTSWLLAATTLAIVLMVARAVAKPPDVL